MNSMIVLHVLNRLLDRLHASLINGPAMNARCHASRQRVDFQATLHALKAPDCDQALTRLLTDGIVTIHATVAPFVAPDDPAQALTPEQEQAKKDWDAQEAMLDKLRSIRADANGYLEDHGEPCLAIGHPVLSIPPNAPLPGGGRNQRGGRILAPLLFMPVKLTVTARSYTLTALHEGAERHRPNPALVAWLEQRGGKSYEPMSEDHEDIGTWWAQAEHLLRWVQHTLGISQDRAFIVNPHGSAEPLPALQDLGGEIRVLPSAVLGLFPLTHHALIQDTRWMQENVEALPAVVTRFLDPRAFDVPKDELNAGAADASQQRESHPPVALRKLTAKPAETKPTRATDHRAVFLVASADPCQMQAVAQAQNSEVLVIHGPPGTGKSQTIANIIGDFLARGLRVLFVSDKRTALDEVFYRLEAARIGLLCGVVHDPSEDRTPFFRRGTACLESLRATPLPHDPTHELEMLNQQSNQCQEELERYRQTLHGVPSDGGRSFHDLLGEWLGLVTRPDHHPLPDDVLVDQSTLSHSRMKMEEVLHYAAKVGHGANPFVGTLALTPADVIQRTSRDWLSALGQVRDAAQDADALAPDSAPPFAAAEPLATQAEARSEAARLLNVIRDSGAGTWASDLFHRPSAQIECYQRELASLAAAHRDLQQPLDATLRPKLPADAPLVIGAMDQAITALENWVGTSAFWRLFSRNKRKAAREIVAPFGVDLNAAPRVLEFYRGLRARRLVVEFLMREGAGLAEDALWQDAILLRHLATMEAVVLLRLNLQRDAAWQPLEACVKHAMRFSWAAGEAATGLAASANHAAALAAVIKSVAAMKLFQPDHVAALEARWKGGEPASRAAGSWVDFASHLEDVARLHDAVAQLPAALQGPMRLFVHDAVSMETVWASLRCHVVMRELRERFQRDGDLARIDGARVTTAFTTLLNNSRRKPSLVRDLILRHWLRIQKDRLVHPMRPQLSEVGLALRNRLALPRRGRLTFRRMLEAGSRTPGGDPIYDLFPVWMAGPSTVAQIFPKEAIFDLIVFDEASQCRLEHAVPVLLRGQRVIIAGDPKQLPPTRFFEARIIEAAGEDDDECAAAAPTEAEDLLSAALNLRVSEAHLDIHYRSQNAALIGFSNTHFYRERLQPLPAHPRNRVTETPIKLEHVGGTYTKSRTNPAEAAAIVKKVAELLEEPNPPSIGIACFNLPQRNAILKALEKHAETDPQFASRYAQAQERYDRGTFQGLFVKNLENVQGAERDVMLISTTFAPRADGRFTQNFGALSRQGGERRLNVLVTRARQAIYLFTSIPKEKYQIMAPEADVAPDSGRSLLYAYLRYAEEVAAHFECFQDSIEQCRCDEPPTVTIGKTATPSLAAEGLGTALFQQHGIGSHVHWGSDGFAIDVACIHPQLPADVTIGVLADFTRYPKTHDPIAWDVFRTMMLESQGWDLHRVWTPQLFWRHVDHLKRLAHAHRKQVAGEPLLAME